ncbi:unnamed protein product [Urochloa humidicola]
MQMSDIIVNSGHGGVGGNAAADLGMRQYVPWFIMFYIM